MRTPSDKTKKNTKKFLRILKKRTHLDFIQQKVAFRGVTEAGEKCSLSQECGICKEHSPGPCVDAGILIQKDSDEGTLVKWNRPFKEPIEVAYDMYAPKVRTLVNERKAKSNLKLGKIPKRKKSVVVNIQQDVKPLEKEKTNVVANVMTKEEFRKTCKIDKDTLPEMTQMLLELSKLPKGKRTSHEALKIEKYVNGVVVNIDVRDMFKIENDKKRTQSYITCARLRKLKYFNEDNNWIAGVPSNDMSLDILIDYRYDAYLSEVKREESKLKKTVTVSKAVENPQVNPTNQPVVEKPFTGNFSQQQREELESIINRVVTKSIEGIVTNTIEKNANLLADVKAEIVNVKDEIVKEVKDELEKFAEFPPEINKNIQSLANAGTRFATVAEEFQESLKRR